MNLSVAVLLLVFVAIAARTVDGLRLPIWQIMGLGALAVLVSGQIGPVAALRAIDPDVMVFLAAMFLVGTALERSGYLAQLAARLFQGARSVDRLVLTVLFGVGAASALLMNDTLAVVGTPLMLMLARTHRIDARMLLLTLAFAVTLGSVMSPIGNPQNLLIALHGGMNDPFLAFLSYLALPTALNLLLAYGVLRWRFRSRFHGDQLVHVPVPVTDPHLAMLARSALRILVLLLVVRIALRWLGLPAPPLSAAAAAAALPLVIFSPRRGELMRNIDWSTLVFFAAMFVLMQSVWDGGFFQGWMARFDLRIDAIPTILVVSTLLSQLISNVPLVALYLPMLTHAGGSEAALLALAVGSTVAGNLFILGAASNVIIVQGAERRGGPSLSFLEFASVGVPITVLSLGVYWGFFHWVYGFTA
ncbi:MAG: SLC13 family permease [Gammaproteobacteria bacterium]